jgi:hypothetical protein
MRRQLESAVEASKGRSAAEEMARRSDVFAKARQQLPTLRQAHAEAGNRWTQADADHGKAVHAHEQVESSFRDTQRRLAAGERDAERREREWSERSNRQHDAATKSRLQRRRFPPRCKRDATALWRS